MIGFDPNILRRALKITDRYVPAVLIAIGKDSGFVFQNKNLGVSLNVLTNDRHPSHNGICR